MSLTLTTCACINASRLRTHQYVHRRGAILCRPSPPCQLDVQARGLAHRPRSRRIVEEEHVGNSNAQKAAADMRNRFMKAADWQKIARLHQNLGRQDDKTRERGERIARERLFELFEPSGRKEGRHMSNLVAAAQQLHPNLLEPVAVCAAEQLNGEFPLSDIEVGFLLISFGNRGRNPSPLALTAIHTLVEDVRERIDTISRRALFMSLSGASCVDGYDMSSFLAAVENHFSDEGRLKGVRPQGLIDIASAASRHIHLECARKLISRVSEVFPRRLPDFQPSEAVMALRALSFGRLAASKKFSKAVEEYFGGVMASLSNTDLSRLAEALLGCKLTGLLLREEILTRSSGLQLRQLVSLFRYVTIARQMDSQLLNHLVIALPRFNLNSAHPKDVAHLLEVVCDREVSSARASLKIGKDLAKIIGNRLEEFPPGLCARLVRSLNEMQVASAELLERLYGRVNFASLSFDEFVWLVYGLSLSEEGCMIGRTQLLNEEYNLQLGSLTLEEAMLLGKGLRRLGLIHQPWLSVLVQFVQEIAGSVGRSSVMLLGSLLIELSLMNASLRCPLEDCCQLIEAADGLQGLPLPTAIHVLSAAAVQDVFPKNALCTLFEIVQRELDHLDLFEKQSLLALDAVMRRRLQSFPPLLQATCSQLKTQLKSSITSLSTDVLHCVSSLANMFTSKLFRRPFVTAEGFLVHGALIRDGTSFCQWREAEQVSRNCSAEELKLHGMQPVAFLVVPSNFCDINGEALGRWRLLAHALYVSGWHVVTIPFVKWKNAPDADEYIKSALQTLGESC